MLDIFTQLDWRQPLWLLLALQPFLLWLLLHRLKKRKQQKFADEPLLPWLEVVRKNHWRDLFFSRNTAYFAAWILCSLALAGPRLPETSAQPQNETVLDIMLVVDLSESMRATDIKPSRLRRATLEAFELLSLARQVRIGVTVFAGRPHLFIPLTTDFNALNYYLESMDSLQLPTRGSDVSAAMAFAKKALLNAPGNHKQALVLLTDGDIQPDKVQALKSEIKLAKNSGINTYILGLGTIEGEAIPRSNGLWREVNGQAVISKMNKPLLLHLSELGGGTFTRVTDNASDWNMLYKKGMLSDLKTPVQKDKQQWKALFQWALFPGIIMLMAALLPISSKRYSISSPVLFSIILTPFLLYPTEPVYATENTYQASVLTGIDAYKNAHFAQSKRLFIDAVLKANTNHERAIALHNLGNALFQSGDYASAAEVFTDALRYNPKQKQSIKNQHLSLALLTLLV